jgi:hypothetical protein
MLNFCTLFDSNYLARGLVTYESLVEQTKGTAWLYVFAFDDRCYETLRLMALPNLTVIPLTEFEDEALLAIKPTRSRGEYCWTCTSSTILYCIEKFGLSHCTYIDADMYFYQNPQILIDEKPTDAHVIITEHRYTPQYDKSKLSGTYCVQFMYFDSSENGLAVLRWWRDQCLAWCFNRFEDGKFGDQKYLDDWTERFTGVHVLRHLGGGLAPWNVQQYHFQYLEDTGLVASVKESYVLLPANKVWFERGGTSENPSDHIFAPIFFHFHGVKLYENGAALFAPKMYILNASVRAFFYEPYIREVKRAQEKLLSFAPEFGRLGFLSSKEFHEDRRKGWWGFVKTNVLNRYLKTQLN